MGKRSLASAVILGCLGACIALGSVNAWAIEPEVVKRDSASALEKLRAKSEAANKLAPAAKGILVFPSILKAGFLFGGQIGNGVLLKNGQPDGYYNSVGASYGLQAGIQKFGYALFFMDDDSLKRFVLSSGFEIGVGPSVVVVDTGAGAEATTTTLREGILAFVFDQKGLMAGVGLKGSKITKIRE
jgi:lipid-binding SYLF domain-containing protein